MVDASGEPIGGLTVNLAYQRRELSEASQPLNPVNIPVRHIGRRETVSDANGEFRIESLFPGHEFSLIFEMGEKDIRPGVYKSTTDGDREARRHAEAWGHDAPPA